MCGEGKRPRSTHKGHRESSDGSERRFPWGWAGQRRAALSTAHSFSRRVKRDKHTSEHMHLPDAQHNTQCLMFIDVLPIFKQNTATEDEETMTGPTFKLDRAIFLDATQRERLCGAQRKHTMTKRGSGCIFVVTGPTFKLEGTQSCALGKRTADGPLEYAEQTGPGKGYAEGRICVRRCDHCFPIRQDEGREFGSRRDLITSSGMGRQCAPLPIGMWRTRKRKDRWKDVRIR